ncbi:MAG: polymerase III, alpha subunit protein [candidate division TM6 bacterium GW2011_GWF2_32_72]|nr:MAG: polymerase III, alpha subunit protein [candidate division TM6 bacterium GW2011_GWF2_32_72]
MSEKHFTHLHLHTDFSLLDGAITLDNYIKYGKEHNFKALGISDHGNIFGGVKFFQKCKKAGIKPILGMEGYFTPDVSLKEVNENKRYFHSLLIVQNQIGYKNLCKLISFAFQKGFYFKPRFDYSALEKYSEGLIVSSACLGGHIPQLLIENKDAEAMQQIDWFLKIFGEERFYLEVQPPFIEADGKEIQKFVNDKIFNIAQQKGLKTIATCDAHYLKLQDREAHEIMLAIQTRCKMSDPERMSFGNCHTYARTQEEMLEIFKDHPEAVWNTGALADSCKFEYETGKLFLPKFEIPENDTPESFFQKLCRVGLQELIDYDAIPKNEEKKYWDRLELEIDLIIKMGFVGYFLIVGDFIQWGKKNNIPIGPGRGSAAGSLVAWALKITNIDPLKYNLLFERFLNPERVSMPDIDIDFCIEGREKVINYVKDKYGHDKVCQIITFGTMAAKGVLKDVARALGFPFEDSNALTNLVPEQLKITLKEAIEQEPKLQEMINSNPQVKELFDVSFKLEGLTRHASKHAAGIVISPEPIDEVLPLYVPAKTTELVAQYAMTELESIGFLKMDFLGLKNLTLIDRALKMIETNHGININIDKIPLDDPKAFQLLCEGKTTGVFQLESGGLKEVLRKLQPDKFEDIIAVNALYRPGPLGSGMVDDFIERRHGRQKITYQFKELEPVLDETYGVIVYQEQVMKIATAIAGYTLGESDILRRAMGKKKAEVMVEQKKIFVEKSIARNFDEKKAGELFDLMAYFAGYGFNKSHSAAYALIAYQTAYLKANYPAEFLACLISLEATNPEKMTEYLQEAKDWNIEILPPDINKSQVLFTAINGKILFGLQGIKNVGLAALENIVIEQQKKPFRDILDFCKRVDLRTANKRVIESLIAAGATDSLPGYRSQKYAELEKIINMAVEQKTAESTGQMGLFGMGVKPKGEEGNCYTFQSQPEWTDKEKLEKEKEMIGFYISSHPLEGYKKQTRRLQLSSFQELIEQVKSKKLKQEPIVTAYGLLKSKRAITTKKGDPMAFIQLEDETSKCEVILFPKTFKKYEQWLDDYQIFVVKGALDLTSETLCKIKANEFIPIELFFEQWPQMENVTLTLPANFSPAKLDELKNSFQRGKASLDFKFLENGKTLKLATRQLVSVNEEFVLDLEKEKISVKIKC